MAEEAEEEELQMNEAQSRVSTRGDQEGGAMADVLDRAARVLREAMTREEFDELKSALEPSVGDAPCPFFAALEEADAAAGDALKE